MALVQHAHAWSQVRHKIDNTNFTQQIQKFPTCRLLSQTVENASFSFFLFFLKILLGGLKTLACVPPLPYNLACLQKLGFVNE